MYGSGSEEVSIFDDLSSARHSAEQWSPDSSEAANEERLVLGLANESCKHASGLNQY